MVKSECLNEWLSKWKPIYHKIWKERYRKIKIKQCYDIPFLTTTKIPAYNFTQELLFHEWTAGLREQIILFWFYSALLSMQETSLKTAKATRHILIITVPSYSAVLCSLQLFKRCNFVCCFISVSFITESSTVELWYFLKYVKHESLSPSALNVDLRSKHGFVGITKCYSIAGILDEFLSCLYFKGGLEFYCYRLPRYAVKYGIDWRVLLLDPIIWFHPLMHWLWWRSYIRWYWFQHTDGEHLHKVEMYISPVM